QKGEQQKPQVLAVSADRKEATDTAICRREPFEEGGSFRRFVTPIIVARRISTTKQLACEQSQARLVIDIVPLGKGGDRYADFARAGDRLSVDALGAPIDRLEQALVKML